MIKKILIGACVAGAISAGITIYSLYTDNQKIKADRATMEEHYKSQIAILEHPKEKIDENKEVIKIVYKDKKGDDVIIKKVVTKTITEKEPVILEQPALNTETRRYYISGAMGYSLSGNVSFGGGVGYNFSDNFSTGVRYDNFGKEHRLGLEIRIDF